MFRRSDGPRNFDTCKAREVEFNRTTSPEGSDYTWRSSSDASKRNAAKILGKSVDEVIFVNNGNYNSELHCPRTESDKTEIISAASNHPTQREAFNDLRRLAVATVCPGCPFPGMTKAEVAISRRDQLEAETALLEAEMAHRSALQELDNMFPDKGV